MIRKHNNSAKIHMTSWSEIRSIVASKNPEFAKIVDSIHPGPEHYLYKATYPFGSEILKGGVFFIPSDKGNFLPLDNLELNQQFKKDLDYNLCSNPISIILKNSAELFFFQDDNSIFPLYSLALEGRVFGTWHVLSSKQNQHPAFLWDMTAGARSLFMLPKISEKGKHAKLAKKFGLSMEPPRNHLEQWSVFREIAQHPEFGEEWNMEILFFPKSWVESIQNDPAWLPLKTYLLQTAWDGSDGMRNQYMWDLIISAIHKYKETKPDFYIAEMTKNLLSLGAGNLPGFSPATNDIAGPIRRLQEIYLNIYKLKDYAPIIMRPSFFSFDDHSQPVYYSLSFTVSKSVTRRADISKIADIYNIKNLLRKYLDGMRDMELHLQGSLFFDLPKKVQYDFFHTDYKEYSDIHPTTKIHLEDDNFKKIPCGGDREFPSNSSFINGCVRVKTKDIKQKV